MKDPKKTTSPPVKWFADTAEEKYGIAWGAGCIKQSA